jgi:uncharacterized membrane protein YfcA
VDWGLIAAGFGVGVTVGMTGMGGGALMTPILVLFFGIPPMAAVSSDLVASAVMKPAGSLVHIRRKRVDWALVRWLCAGSVPAAFCGALLARALGGHGDVEEVVRIALGVALLLAVVGLAVKAFVKTGSQTRDVPRVKVKPVPTVVLGALGGLVVGMTSVGSGSLIIVVLLALYPMLRPNDLVGTDLVQAVPLVASAALGHLIFGDFRFDLATALLAGSIPGVLLGAHISSKAPAGLVRSALGIVLLASAMKLLHAGNLQTLTVVTAAAIALGAGRLVVTMRAPRSSQTASPPAG